MRDRVAPRPSPRGKGRNGFSWIKGVCLDAFFALSHAGFPTIARIGHAPILGYRLVFFPYLYTAERLVYIYPIVDGIALKGEQITAIARW